MDAIVNWWKEYRAKPIRQRLVRLEERARLMEQMFARSNGASNSYYVDRYIETKEDIAVLRYHLGEK